MHRLYILGALALSNVQAYVNVGTYGSPSPTVAAPTAYGSVTYTSTGDCFTTGTATSLGMNNIYYQYYTFSITKGSNTYSTVTQITGTAPDVVAVAVNACTHSHLYNWMAQPAVGASTSLDGLGEAVVAYGYVMSGTTLTACALANAVVTTSLYSSTTKVFSGARFGHVNAIVTPVQTSAPSAHSTAISPILTTAQAYGANALYTKVVTAQSYTAYAPAITSPAIPAVNSILEVDIKSAQNFYFDFAQTNVFQGQTQFGRGGGASTAPCGWWVVYTYESGVDNVGGNSLKPTSWNLDATWASATVHMWTDNALVNSLGAFVLAALGAALY